MLKRWLRLLLVSVVVIVVGCSKHTPDERQVVSENRALITPKIDSRSYRALVLPNGLRVMLVHDAAATKAAASLNVDVGSGADPKGREGLAHFLEHMLFLGTKKYPEAGEYQAFISSQGGQHNAYTSYSDTNYFFDVDANAFEPTLDRFAAFFYAPLFSQAYLERERNAVNSEYHARIDNEMRRFLDVLKTQLNPKHPFSKFTVGNLDTLYVDNLAADVRAFYERYYRAGNMSLAMVSPASLDTQEQWVRAKFSAIAAGQQAAMAQAEPLFSAGSLPVQLFISPKQERRSLSLSFPIPNVYGERLNKPTMLLGHLLGHEGEGSLFQVLRQKGWLEGLSAGNFLDDNGESLFTVTMSLTPVGVVNKDAIVAAVFAAIKLIEREGIKPWRYEELARVSGLQFDYQAQSQALAQAQSLAANMADYPQAYWLKGPYAMEQFAPDIVAAVIARLTPSNAVISLVAPELETDQVSPWYNTAYRVAAVDAEQLAQWQNPPALAGLHLPEANPFIPTELGLIAHDDAQPTVLRNESNFRVWHQALNRFNEPRAYVKLGLDSAVAGRMPQQSAVLAVAAKMLDDEVNARLYEAKAMGYQFSINASAFGLEISAYGYAEKIDELLAATIAPIKSIQWSHAQFLRARDELVRRWRNMALQPPYQVLADVQRADYEHPSWRKSVLADSAEGLSFDTFLNQWQQLSNVSFVNGLIVGNVDKPQADVVADIMARFAPRAKTDALAPKMTVLPVVADTVTPLPLSSADSAVLVYLQAPAQGFEARALSALTASVFEADFYSELRTQQQLGYVVHFANRLLAQTPGMMMIVQSPRYDAEYIVKAIDAFWAAQMPVIGELESQFTRHKQSLAVSLLQPPTNTAELAQRQWRNIEDGVLSFDQRQQLVAALEAISFEQWQAFVRQTLSSSYGARHVYIAKAQ